MRLTLKVLAQGLMALCLFSLMACQAGKPTSKSIKKPSTDPGPFHGVTSPSRVSLASSTGVATSGTVKVKFAIGYNQGASGPTMVSSGTTYIRPASMGVLNER